jgi:hypothetical protein
MQKIKRLTIWLFETSFEAMLLGLTMVVLFGYDTQHFAGGLLVYAGFIMIFFFLTGYLLTTVIFRAFWKSRSLWQYSAIATGLFLLHFEILNIGIGGAFAPHERYRVLGTGLCIAFACTYVGTFVLNKWVPDRISLSVEPVVN